MVAMTSRVSEPSGGGHGFVRRVQFAYRFPRGYGFAWHAASGEGEGRRW